VADDKFLELLLTNSAVRQCYDAATLSGLSEEQRLKAVIVALADLNKRAMSIIAAAAVYGGMPITQEVADVRNEIVCGKSQG
jgi:hypothetical protein